MMIGEMRPEAKGPHATWTAAERERRRRFLEEQRGGEGALVWALGSLALAVVFGLTMLMRAC